MNKNTDSLPRDNSLNQIALESELAIARTGGGTEAARTKLKMLVEVLNLLIDSGREHTAPILNPRDGKVRVGAESCVHGIEWVTSLIPLLSAGLNDKAIAQALNISSSTLSRRISDLKSIYGVRTRFQLGSRIARSKDVSLAMDNVTRPRHFTQTLPTEVSD